MKANRARKLFFDAFAVLLFTALSLWLSRPWILHPRTLSIGMPGPIAAGRYFLIGNPDVVMNLTFAGWLKFSATQLHEWPLARTPYLMYPVGAEQGASFDGLALAAVAALLAGAMPLDTAFAVAQLLAIILSGFVFYRLAHRLWGRGALALALGLNAAGLPFLIQRLAAHPNLLYIWTIPAAVHLYLNFERKPTLKRAAAWGLSFPLLALGSWHVLLIGLIFQGGAAAIAGARALGRRDWARLAGLGLAWGLGCALVAAVGWPMLTHAGQRAYRPIAVLTGHSTPLLQQIMPYPYSWIGGIGWIERLQQRIGTPWEGWSGGPVVSLALLLLYLRWWRPQGPRLLIGLTALAALGMTMGPVLQVRHVHADGVKLPLYFLLRSFPALSMIHVPGRYAVLLHFMALLASGYLIQTLRARTRPESRLGRVAWPAAIWGMVGLNLACTLGPFPVSTSPNLAVPDFYKTLGRQAGKGAVLDVPISNYWFPQYNYYQFAHKRPAVSSVLFHDAVQAADTGFIYGAPAMRFFTDKNKGGAGDAVLGEITAPDFMARLKEEGIEYVVVHPKFLEFLEAAKLIDPRTAAGYAKIEAAWKGRRIWSDGEIRVYRTG